MVKIYISLGSNIDREANTRAGVAALRQAFGELELSSVFESEAVGFEGDAFFNMVIAADTAQPVEQVAAILHRIEAEQGRSREGPKFSSRTLDLDLLLYGDQVVDQPGLQIPRDEILKRAFVLWQLAEIAHDDIHPQVGRSYGELWQDFDKTRERLMPIRFEFDA